MEHRKHLSSIVLAVMLLTQMTTGTFSAFEPIQQSSAATNGDFKIEGASEKFEKTWIMTITCRSPNGALQTYAGETKFGEMGIPFKVAEAIRSKNLPYVQPTKPLISSTGGSEGEVNNTWIIGTPHEPTLNAVCKILGSSGDTFASFTCHDGERGAYPAGKCNYDSPGDDQLMRFVGTFAIPECSDTQDNDVDGVADIRDPDCHTDGDARNPGSYDGSRDESGTSGIPQCQNTQDDDQDGRIDHPSDPGCSSPRDPTETNDGSPTCDNGRDDNNNGPIDCRDPVCHTDGNANNVASCNPGGSEVSPRFSGQKTADVPDVTPGGIVTYTIRFTNTGNAPQHNVRITDTVPNNMTYVQNGSTAGCLPQGGAVVCPAQTVNPGQEISAVLKFQLNAGTQCGSGQRIENTANLEQNAISFTSASISSTRIECPAPINADMSVTVQNAPTTVQRGERFTVSLKGTNNGPAVADYPVISLPIPPGANFLGARGCFYSQNGTAIDCPMGSAISSGVSSTFDLQFDVSTCGANVTFRPTVSSPSPDLQLSNNSDQHTVTTQACPILECSDTRDNDVDGVADIRDPDCHTDGDARNPGSYDGSRDESGTNGIPQCQNTQDDDQDGRIDHPSDPGCSSPRDPTETNDGSPTCDNGRDDNNNGPIDCRDPVCHTDGNANNVASCNPGGSEDDLFADVDVISNDGPDEFNQGGIVSYNVHIRNIDRATAQNVRFTHTFVNAPQSFTFKPESSSSGCRQDGSRVLCDRGSSNGFPLRFNESENFVLVYQSSPQLPCNPNVTSAATENEGKVTTTTPESNTSNNTDNTRAIILCAAPSFTITKSALTPSVVEGTKVSYKITVRNNGNAQGNVIIKDQPGPGLDFDVSSGISCQDQSAGGEVTCSPVTFAAGETKEYILTFNAIRQLACGPGRSLQNSASVFVGGTSFTTQSPTSVSLVCSSRQCSNGGDDDNDNLIDFPEDPGCTDPSDDDESPENTGMTKIVKSGPPSVAQGDIIPYTLRVMNWSANHTVFDVVVRDHIPVGLTFVQGQGQSDPRCQQVGSDVVCRVPSLVARDFTVFNVAFQTPNNGSMCNQTVTNTVTAKAKNSMQDNTSFPTLITCPAATFLLSKTDYRDTAAPGDTLTYVLSVTNTSQTDATNVTFTDKLPDGVSFVSATDGKTPSNGILTWTEPFIARGQPIFKTVTVTVNQNALNNAILTNELKLGNQTATDQTRVIVPPTQSDISIIKTGSPQVQRGGTISYTLTVSNAGPAVAQNVTVTDALPAGLANVQVSGPNCHPTSSDSRNISCVIPTLTPGIPVPITITAQVPMITGCTEMSITNNADIAAATDSTPNNNHSEFQTTLTCPPAPTFLLSKTDYRDTAAPGETLTYVLSVTNTSQTDATNVTFTDKLPDGVSFVSATDGKTPSGGILTWTEPFIARGQPIFKTVTVTVNQNASNNAILTNELRLVNQSATDQTRVIVPPPETADLSIVKSTTQASVEYGSQITYTLTVTNIGSATATPVTVTDTLPTGFTFVSAPGANCNSTASPVVCTIPTLASGQTVPITMILQAPPQGGSCNQQIAVNSASVSSPVSDPATANNTSTVETLVRCPPPPTADLSIVKTTTQPSVQYGSQITYTLNVTLNPQVNGASVVAPVTVTDTLPTGFTFVSAPGANCNSTASPVVCTIPTLASGQTAPITMILQAPAASANCQASTALNSASVSSSFADLNPTNNQSSVQTPVTCIPVPTADLQIQKSGPTTAIRGNTITYAFIATNKGPAPAQNVVITDPLPAGYTFGSVSGANCQNENNVLTCTLAEPLLPGAWTNLITVTYNIPVLPHCTQPVAITNTATVASTTSDPISTNNAASVATQVACQPPETADLGIVKSTAQTSVQYGSQITYTLNVTNNGPAIATPVTVTDTFPVGFTFVSASGPACNNTALQSVCTIPTLASGQTAPITMILQAPVASAICQPSTALNSASVSSALADPNSTNNQSSVQTPVTCIPAQTADLTVSKTGTQTAQYGNGVTYTVTPTNTGPSAIASVTVTDTIPVGLTYASVTGATCTLTQPAGRTPPDNGILTCDVGTLASGQSKPFTLNFTTAVPAVCVQPGSVTNNVTITENDPNVSDANTVNNSAQAFTTLTCPPPVNADLSIVKTGSLSTLYGTTFSYSLVVTNNGTAPVNSVTVADPLPLNLSFVSGGITGAGASCIPPPPNNRGTLVCTIPTLAAGAVSTVSIKVKADDAVAGTCAALPITNIASVSEADPNVTDPNVANNQSQIVTTLTCPVNPNADVSITKSTNQTSVQRGSAITYTLTATNHGPASAQGVVVHDPYDNQKLTFSSATGASCSDLTSEVKCDLGSMTPSQIIPITLTFIAKTVTGTCTDTTVQNTATISTTSPDSVTTNNTTLQPVVTTLTCNNGTIDNISVTKTDNRSTANVLDRLRYSIILTNNSSTVVNSLLVTDNVPYSLAILTASDGATISGQQVRWTSISVPANSSRTLYIDTEVRSDTAHGTVILNTVDVSGKTASDQTTIYNNTYVNPPPPPYYNPLPPYYNPPPPYYNPPPPYVNPPPPYYNPPPPYVNPPPAVIYPLTGDKVVDLYDSQSDTSSVTPVGKKEAEKDNGFSAVFYATLIAILAAGSAAASRFIGFAI